MMILGLAVAAPALSACGASEERADAAVGVDAGPADSGNAADTSVDPSALVGITVALEGAARLSPGETSTITATGHLAGGATIELTRAATWKTSSATTAEIFAGGELHAVAPGIAYLHAERGAIRSDPLRLEVGAPPARTELRGVWVTRWSFSSVADLDRILDDVAAAHLNAIFFQARGTADAYYRSSLEPWASRLSGRLGEDPGWDPLGELVSRAHARGLQVHAWLNTFPAWTGSSPPAESTPRHVLLEHPEWLCADGGGVPMPLSTEGYQFLAAGNPDARRHIADVVEELVGRYEVDGVHMDFIRFPGPQYSHDPVTEGAYAEAITLDPALTFGDFQRAQITHLVTELKARVARARPSAALSVASWGISENKWGWSSVSRGYDDFYQDAHRWAREGLIDALCPMIYWRMTTPKGLRTDFATLAEDHLAAAHEGNRAMFAGMSAELETEELERQIEHTRAIGAEGFVLFDLSLLRANNHLGRLAMGVLSEVVRAPVKPYR